MSDEVRADFYKALHSITYFSDYQDIEKAFDNSKLDLMIRHWESSNDIVKIAIE